jgi:Domain of unknown function (DUF4397)
VNAAPGTGPVSAVVVHRGSPTRVGRPVGFGRMSAFRRVPSGAARVRLLAAGRAVATSAVRLRRGGSYTLVAAAQGTAVTADVYPDRRALAGWARLRTIQAAPELGSADLRLGRRVFARAVRYGQATPYHRTRAGTYNLAAVRAGGGPPLVSRRVALAAGTSTTAIVVGTRGKRLRIVVATDATTGPSGAPNTGLGGLARRAPPWRLALAAALAAAALGGLGRRVMSRARP